MNRKSFIITTAAVFVTACIVDFLIHRKLLTGMYDATASLWRPEQDMQVLPMYLSQLLFSIMFVFIFTRNYEHKGPTEGLRYGAYIGLLFAAVDLATYTWLPIPFALTLSWMGAMFIKCVLCGYITAIVYRSV